MDTGLQAMARAAERGEAVPRVALLTSSGTIFGQPISSTELIERYRASSDPTTVRRRDTAKAEAAAGWVNDVADQLSALDDLGPDSSALCLGDVRILTALGGEVIPPALRVSIEAVDSWFIGLFSGAFAPIGGKVGFIGGSVPVDTVDT